MRFGPKQPFDVIVCGAGHAGCEAALAASRMGAQVLLLTGNIDSVAQMSCNPAIGGQAKGQMVREIDALGGEMAVNTDTTAIQFRLLNASKGPAVQAPRAQCDKKAYQFRMKHVLELQRDLTLFPGSRQRTDLPEWTSGWGENEHRSRFLWEDGDRDNRDLFARYDAYRQQSQRRGPIGRFYLKESFR